MGLFSSELIKDVKEYEKLENDYIKKNKEFEELQSEAREILKTIKSKAKDYETKSAHHVESAISNRRELNNKLEESTLDFALMDSNKAAYDKNINNLASEINSLNIQIEAMSNGLRSSIHRLCSKEIEEYKKVARKTYCKRMELYEAIESVRTAGGKIFRRINASQTELRQYLERVALADIKMFIGADLLNNTIEYITDTRVAHNVHEEYGIDMNTKNSSFGEVPKDLKEYPSPKIVVDDFITQEIINKPRG